MVVGWVLRWSLAGALRRPEADTEAGLVQHPPVFPATLFDFNGVLVDDERVHLEAFQETLKPLGIELSTDDYWEKYLGFDDKGAFEAILRDSGRTPSSEEILGLIEAKRPHYLRRAELTLETFPGAADLVRRRAAYGPVGVVSGALTAEIEFGLERLGVRELVRRIVSAEDTQRSKPDPEGYLMGLEWLRDLIGEKAKEALVFEDSPAGIHAAKAAGFTVVGLGHSYDLETLRGAGADWTISRLELLQEEDLVALYRARFGS